MVKYGSWDGCWVVPRYSPSQPPQSSHHPGYTPPAHAGPGMLQRCAVRCGQTNSAVGLRSVGQLSLYVHFSDIRGMTEVYNLIKLGNPNDHNVIPGTE